MKKVILAFVLVVVGATCFAKIISVRGIYKNCSYECFKNGTSINSEAALTMVKYFYDFLANNMIGLDFVYEKIYQSTKLEHYVVCLAHNTVEVTTVCVMYFGSDGYKEMLFLQGYFDYNAAKRDFDQFCNTYYNKISK